MGAMDVPPPPTLVQEGASLVEEYAAGQFFEGPTWDHRTGSLYFTMISSDHQQILRLEERGRAVVWMKETEEIRGMIMSVRGNLLGAQAKGHRIVSYGIGEAGPVNVRTLVFDPTFHQPNDLCQTPRGDIYFTDPDFKDRKTSAVYHLALSGHVAKAITDMAVPNGIAAAPNGRTLYVSDSHAKHWKAFSINKDGLVGEGRIFFEFQTDNQADPDGLTVDEKGNVYMTGLGGVWVASAKGELLGFIPIPEYCSNLVFGGKDGRTLYMTCSKKIYSLRMTVRGVGLGGINWPVFSGFE